MPTLHPSIPVWPKTLPNRASDTYWAIVNNFARCCADEDVIFYDGTYAPSPYDIIQAIKKHDKAIVFNMVDPPYTWHYLEELMQGLDTKILLVGTDAPDIATSFWLAWAHLEWPHYTAEDLQFRPNGDQLIFLSHNYKPHEHRVRLRSMLESRGLLSSGHFTLFDQDLDRNPVGRETNLGDLDIWQRHFLNVVSETVFRLMPELIVSEKTVKAILGLRPFVINGSPRYYDILESWGIDIFSDILPTDQMRRPADDLHECMDRNISLIGDAIESFSNTPLEKLYHGLLHRLESNQIKMKTLMAAEYKKLCVDDIKLAWRSLR